MSTSDSPAAYWVVFDPVSRRSFRVGWLEHTLLIALKKAGPTGLSAPELCQQLQATCSGSLSLALTHQKLQQLSTSQLIKTPATSAPQSAKTTPESLLGQLWAWRVRGPNLDPWLGQLASQCNLLFGRNAVRVWLAFSVFTAFVFLLDFDRLWQQVGWLDLGSLSAVQFEDFLGWFLKPSTGGLFCVIFLVTRLLHELGHGIACKRFGVRCPDIGVLFVLGTPCVYCDVSESWRLPRAQDRAAIAAAGVYAELIVATLAAWLWMLTVDGPWNTLALQVVICCSISTLLINANPLMRFDGYYVLADWLGEANLRAKADGLASNCLSWLLIGTSDGTEATCTPNRKAGLIAFSIAGFLYRILLTWALASIVIWTYDSWQLTWLGRFMACLLFVSFWGLPMFRWLTTLFARARTTRNRLQFGLVLSCILLGLFFLPLPNRKTSLGLVHPTELQGVYASSSGILTHCFVQDGEQVDSEQILFRLENPALELQQIKRERDVKLTTVQLASARRERDMYGATRDLLRVEHTLASARSLQDDARRQVDNLHLASPQAGRFCAAEVALEPWRSEQGGALDTWCDADQLNRQLPQGTLLGWVCSSDFYVLVPLSDELLGEIAVGTRARVQLPGVAGRAPAVCEAEVVSIVQLDTPTLNALVAPSIPSGVRFGAVVEWSGLATPENADALRPGQGVDTVFLCQSQTLARQSLNWLRNNLRLMAD